MVTVQVISRSTGKPVQGRRVSIGFDGLTRGFSKDGRTDANGEVHFTNDPGKGTIYVDGSNKHQGRIEGRTVIYV